MTLSTANSPPTRGSKGHFESPGIYKMHYVSELVMGFHLFLACLW